MEYSNKKLHLGNKIKTIAEKQKLTVEDLATKTEKTIQTIYDIFKKPHVNTQILEQFAEVFGMDIKDFFEDVENSKEESEILKDSGSNHYDKKMIEHILKVNNTLLEILSKK